MGVANEKEKCPQVQELVRVHEESIIKFSMEVMDQTEGSWTNLKQKLTTADASPQQIKITFKAGSGAKKSCDTGSTEEMLSRTQASWGESAFSWPTDYVKTDYLKNLAAVYESKEAASLTD